MLPIEEYIARRKKEDRLNEFDMNQRAENLKTCVNYVFEYFNNYLDITEADEKTALHNEKIEKYRQQLQDFDLAVQDWLVQIFAEYGKHMNRIIANILKQDEFFLLYDLDSEFRSLSYDCYAKLIKKFPFLKDQTEMLFQFIKDYHHIYSHRSYMLDFPYISEEFNDWIEKTREKHGVNVVAFADNWVNYFYDDEDSWPATHRSKSPNSWRKYEYDFRQKSNLFNLDSLYRKMPKKSFTRGRKQEFEILMMYFWIHSICGDEDYWQEYLDKVMPSLK